MSSGRLGRQRAVLLHAEVRERPVGEREGDFVDERGRLLLRQVVPAGHRRDGPAAGSERSP